MHTDERHPRRHTFSTSLRRNRETVSLYLFLAALVLFAAISTPRFTTKDGLTNIFGQVAPMGFVSLGMTFVILTTGIDLSVGAVMSLTTTILATVMIPGRPGSVFLALGTVVVASLVIGTTSGLLVAIMNFEPLIATLAVGTIVNGVTLLILPYPGGFVPPMFTDIWLHRIGGVVPCGFVLFLVAVALAYCILKYTTLGRRLYAVGGNETHSAVAGIPIRRVKFSAYVISALFACISGIALASRMRSGDPLAGAPFTLTAVAATVVGGTTFSGGVGGVVGTFAGVMILGVLSVMLNIAGVSPFIKDMLTGVIIVITVNYASYRRR